MDELATAVDDVAATTGFSGVVRVDRVGTTPLTKAYGLADRAHRVPNTVGTRFGIASGTKGLTALTVVSLVEDGVLALDTAARAVLGDDLPLVPDGVTVEHLLAHTSGIGDYVDEDAGFSPEEFVLAVPPHRLDTTEGYVAALDGRPPKFGAGERFSYSNSGYVVLALLAERVTGTPFPELVDRRVCEPVGMGDTAFLRTDELPGTAATGYLHGEGLRTNVLHLPVRGSGDGGAYSTAADVHALWSALFAERILPRSWVERMTSPVTLATGHELAYGLGFWVSADRTAVVLEGCDAGVSFRSVHRWDRGVTWTVLSNTTRGAWPVAARLEAVLGA